MSRINPVLSLIQSGRSPEPQYPLDLPILIWLLYKLVDWYTFGLLLDVPHYELNKIKVQHPVNLDRQKTDLFHYWLKNGRSPNWLQVYGALVNMPKQENEVVKDVLDNVFPLLENIKFTHPFPTPSPEIVVDDVAQSLTKIQTMFARLVVAIRKELDKLPLVDIKLFVSEFLHTTFKSEHEPQTLYQLFDQLKAHYSFMSYKILEVIVGEFVKESMESHIKEYTTQLQDWLQSTTIREFKAAVEHQIDQVTIGKPVCSVIPIVLRLKDAWMDVTVCNLWKLLKYIFRDKSSILTHICIENGSLIVRLLAPKSEILSLISLSSKIKSNMMYLGIESVQVGTVIIRLPLLYPFNFNERFHAAAYENNLSVVNFFITLGINLNSQDESGFTPFIRASMRGNIDIVTTLIDNNADISIMTYKNRSALLAAARFGFEDVTRLLIKAGLSLNNQEESGATPLMNAASAGHVKIVELLIKKKADVNLTALDGQNALMYACRKSSIRIVELLLKAGINPNVQRYDGDTALHIATAYGFLQSGKTLLRYKAKVNIQNNEGVTPLMIAIYFRYHDLVEVLLKKNAGFDMQNNNGLNVLMMAALSNNPTMTAILLKANATVNFQNNEGVTALLLASLKGNKEIVQQLLRFKADPNLCTKNGLSPLHIASQQDVVKLLLKSGALPNAVGGADMETPLHLACSDEEIDIVQILLHGKANPNALTASGLTPLCIAATKGFVRIAETLLKAGADIDLQKVENDWTPLFFAAVNGHTAVVKLLVKYGASIRENKFGLTPKVAASLAGQHDIVRHLSEVAISMLQSTSLPLTESCQKVEPQTSDESVSYSLLTKQEESTSNRPLPNQSDNPDVNLSSRSVYSDIKSYKKSLKSFYDSITKRYENYFESLRSIS